MSASVAPCSRPRTSLGRAVRLLALDLDGTLLRRDGTISPDDAAAIGRARRAGIEVTLATGRLIGGTLPSARVLDLTLPMVCGDGATVACSRDGRVLHGHELSAKEVRGLLGILREHLLMPFILMHDVVHCDRRGEPFSSYLRAWSTSIHIHESFEKGFPEGAIMVMGLGRPDQADGANDVLQRQIPAVVTQRFAFGDIGVVRSFGGACTKAAGLAYVSAQLGMRAEEVAVIGDWYNDLSMFAWAGRSFAMGGAPDEIREAATDSLRALAGEGGGVAEAIDQLLSECLAAGRA